MSITCRQLSKVYDSRGDQLESLNDVTLTVTPKEFVSIVGPSGCGKTTLLKIIAGLLEPSSGQVIIETPQSPNHLRSAMVFQDQGIFPWMTVLDNVCFGLEMQGVAESARHKRGLAFLDKFGMEGFAH